MSLKFINKLVICVLFTGVFPQPIDYFTPEQIHLSLTDSKQSMLVTWVTWNQTSSYANYGLSPQNLTQTASGSSNIFYTSQDSSRHEYIHKVKMSELRPNTTYYYHVGSSLGWSGIFWFKTFPEGTYWSPSIAMYGDMGNINAQSLPRLQQDTQKGMYDAIFHVGDFAYDMNTDEGLVGDEFMRQIESIAAYVPYMTCNGNHEQFANFSHYKARFNMPNDERGDNMYYSFNMGPMHIISLSTEYYYFLNYGLNQVKQQHDWFENDLKLANLSKNREKRPWILVFGHRPMYCSNTDKDDCTKFKARTRVGLPLLHLYGLEDLMYKYKVDLAVWAHEHDYERLWPIYNTKVMNGSYERPYDNPKAPVHIITGSAGCQERHDGFLPLPNRTAFRSMDYGYTRLNVMNGSHLHIQQVSDDQEGAIIDDFWIIKAIP
ncbi:acid phosphatase type 7 [Lepeophtheirus salmonis]|uniref:acid phosphatase type 7 n=1 Tax=Lepeophtheirus salmonis TaxID=72036 RepID=UPI001AE42282|nr:acid phosphatase type 7-like [Lepeophtheirus salmonis]